MEIKTSLETLQSLYNDQLELVLNRRAGVRILEKMNPERVLNRDFDPQTMQMKETTVKDRLETFRETLELDEMRLKEYELMIEEEKTVAQKPKPKTDVE